jgi:serine/threonine-protein kinase
MPFIDGETLRDKLNREKQLGIDEAVKITTEVADALDYAHRQNVIHRDIKPENILLHDSRPMVADFGIALAVSAAAGGRMTETGLSLGTPHYMSPEQATAEKDLTNRSDIYSLGAVLYEMLTGSPPHVGSSAQQIIMKIVTEDPAPVTDTRKAVPPNVAAAVAKALEKFTADRFANANGFSAALLDPMFTRGKGGAVDRRTPASAKGRLVGIVSLVALAAAGAFVAGISIGRSNADPRPVVRTTVAFPLGEEIVLPNQGTSLAISPDGSLLAYTGPSDTGPWQLWVRRRDELHGAPIPGTDGAYSPFFDPTGTQLAFHTGHMTPLRAVPVVGGVPRTVVDAVGDARGDWEDGMIYFQNAAFGISRIPAEGGRSEVVAIADTLAGQLGFGWIDVLAGGRVAVVVLARQEDAGWGQIGLADFETQSVRPLVDGIMGLVTPSGQLVYVSKGGAAFAATFDRGQARPVSQPVLIVDSLRLTPYGGADLAFADDGTLVYATGSARQEVIGWVSRYGEFEAVDAIWHADFHSLALSPDGRALVASAWGSTSAGLDLWARSLGVGQPTRLSLEDAVNINPAWMPRGDSVVIASNRGDDRRLTTTTWRLDLWAQPVDGSPATLIATDSVSIWRGMVSPDGAWIVYEMSASEAGGGDIRAKRREAGAEPVTLLGTSADERHPALSPDGRWLAYTSDASGRREVYVQPFPDAEGRAWPISVDGGLHPAWSRDGTELFYATPSRELYGTALDLRRGVPSVASRSRLFSLADYDIEWEWGGIAVAPDGRFLMIRRNAAIRDLVRVENWFAELDEMIRR